MGPQQHQREGHQQSDLNQLPDGRHRQGHRQPGPEEGPLEKQGQQPQAESPGDRPSPLKRQNAVTKPTSTANLFVPLATAGGSPRLSNNGRVIAEPLDAAALRNPDSVPATRNSIQACGVIAVGKDRFIGLQTHISPILPGITAQGVESNQQVKAGDPFAPLISDLQGRCRPLGRRIDAERWLNRDLAYGISRPGGLFPWSEYG